MFTFTFRPLSFQFYDRWPWFLTSSIDSWDIRPIDEALPYIYSMMCGWGSLASNTLNHPDDYPPCTVHLCRSCRTRTWREPRWDPGGDRCRQNLELCSHRFSQLSAQPEHHPGSISHQSQVVLSSKKQPWLQTDTMYIFPSGGCGFTVYMSRNP